jgi:hypothetical protein
MTDTTIDYDKMVQSALMGVIRKILQDAAEKGLIGDHHFYITFNVNHVGVVMPDHLKAKYPEDMTIVLQNQFWDMIVEDSFFEISLSFNRQKEHLHIPFDALIGFLDPSVDFGLHFQNSEAEEEIPRAEVPTLQEIKSIDKKTSETANVVTLDSFRKK